MDRPDLALYQAAAVALDEFACGYAKGRAKTDAIYQSVVEGRDVPSTYTHYSSCGDRASWKLYRLGCRAKWVNRKSNGGWRVGRNISALAYECPVSKKPGADWKPSRGDEMLIWNRDDGTDAHSLSITGYDGTKARTANYGASGMSAAVFPGAKLGEAPLAFDGKVWRYGLPGHTKVVQRVIRLEDLVPLLTARADLNGPDFTDEFTGEVQDAIQNVFPQP